MMLKKEAVAEARVCPVCLQRCAWMEGVSKFWLHEALICMPTEAGVGCVYVCARACGGRLKLCRPAPPCCWSLRRDRAVGGGVAHPLASHSAFRAIHFRLAERCLPRPCDNSSDGRSLIRSAEGSPQLVWKPAVILPRTCSASSNLHLDLSAHLQLKMERKIPDFSGTWHMKSSQNFDELLKALGVNMMLRMIAVKAASKPEVKITQNGETLSIRTSTTVRTTDITFTVGQEFTESTVDGRPCTSFPRWETESKISCEQSLQKGDGPKTSWTREITSDGKLILTMRADDVVCTRVYERQ
nr:cellular retinoic acid-binding protein 2a [Nothobranchius furzeri]